MKLNLKKTILIFTSFIAFNSYSSIQDLHENVKAKANKLVETHQEVTLFSQINFGKLDIKKCEGARKLIDSTLQRSRNLWSSSTLFGGETEGGIEALRNRLKRFESLPVDQKETQCAQVMKLHINTVENLVASLFRLKKENPAAWQYIIKYNKFYSILKNIGVHITKLQYFDEHISFPSEIQQASIQGFNSVLLEEKKRRIELENVKEKERKRLEIHSFVI